MDFFSDRENGPNIRNKEVIEARVWRALTAFATAKLAGNSFAEAFPKRCPDGQIEGTEERLFNQKLAGLVHEVIDQYGQFPKAVPSTLAILDFIEFCWNHVSKANQRNFHDYPRPGHFHLFFNIQEGRDDFCVEINRLFSRNGLAFELSSDGQVIRLGPELLRDQASRAAFRTGDAELDGLLSDARNRFLDPDPKERKLALKELWNGWERLKTIEKGKDKGEQINALLDRVSQQIKFRDLIGKEAKELTRIGNEHHIRHFETDREGFQNDFQVDYLFYRMLNLIVLILQAR